MSSEEIVTNCKSKMRKAFDVFSQELSSLRTPVTFLTSWRPGTDIKTVSKKKCNF